MLIARPRREIARSRPSSRERNVVLQEILQQDPTINAPQLTARLCDLGHVVSVRTAQRQRGQALHQLGPPDASLNPLEGCCGSLPRLACRMDTLPQTGGVGASCETRREVLPALNGPCRLRHSLLMALRVG